MGREKWKLIFMVLYNLINVASFNRHLFKDIQKGFSSTGAIAYKGSVVCKVHHPHQSFVSVDRNVAPQSLTGYSGITKNINR